ncbi:MAG: aminodeoxychorismate/anthranilate synthase component II [Eubacteriales bacterium]|nr:aminodeoxychorismate/anthranilate synthase component II [Sarcina sp.]MBR2729219.1 aminodeoxychorismate/anthranilate synthase component II [Lachnospiraceae bacterium]MDO4417688.1 aminodeoxychorismate/anthranilate synthase component II [Eubacteriales bacterium]
MILIIDNYDSFSYNLYQMTGTITPEIEVIRNDALTVEEIGALAPEAILLSPGPGRPADAGVCEEVVRALGAKIPILGVCLGHQAICEAYGASIVHAAQLMHGRQSLIAVDDACPLFEQLPETVPAARYHSLAVREDTLPPELHVMARAQDGEVMAVQHRTDPVFGVQFHPESIMTPDGMQMLQNFIGYVRTAQIP